MYSSLSLPIILLHNRYVSFTIISDQFFEILSPHLANSISSFVTNILPDMSNTLAPYTYFSLYSLPSRVVCHSLLNFYFPPRSSFALLLFIYTILLTFFCFVFVLLNNLHSLPFICRYIMAYLTSPFKLSLTPPWLPLVMHSCSASPSP